MSDNRDVAKTLLTEAGRTILKDRPGIHGSAENSFQMIADFWTVHSRHLRKVRGHDNYYPEDVAEMMSMLKKARKVYGASSNMDNDVDDIGYVALGGMLRLPDPDKAADQELADDLAKGIGDRTVFKQPPSTNIDTRTTAERFQPMLGDAADFGFKIDGTPLSSVEYNEGVQSFPTREAAQAAAARAADKQKFDVGGQ